MSRHPYAFAAYQTRQINQATPLQGVVLLYDAVMSRMAQAGAAARRRDYETQYRQALRAAEILNGLCLCLDMQRGAPVAQSLQEMYVATCKAIMSSIGRPNGAECSDRIIEAVRLTRDAWAAIAGMPPSQDRPSPLPVPPAPPPVRR